MIETITVIGGHGKTGEPEPVARLELQMGNVASIVGPTGSGKTTLINDIELFADGDTPADKTWGLRSYDSPPDEPRAGKDVFDVYSLSSAKGLNGVAYRQW